MVIYSLLMKSVFIIMLLCSAFGNLYAASDLVVTTVANLRETLTPGSKFSLTTTVANQGDAASPTTVTNYYLSIGTSKEGAWLLTSKHSVKGLAPLANTTKKVKITVPSGTYYLVACADGANKVKEEGGTNNCLNSQPTSSSVSSPSLFTLIPENLFPSSRDNNPCLHRAHQHQNTLFLPTHHTPCILFSLL